MSVEDCINRIDELTRRRKNLKAAYNELKRPPRDYSQCSLIRSRLVAIDSEIKQLQKRIAA